MTKITPRDILDGLNEIIRNQKAGKRYSADTAIWVSRAKALISKQAAEIEDLKQRLEEYTGNVKEPLPPEPEDAE